MPRPSVLELLRFFQLREALAVQTDDRFQEGYLFLQLFNAAFRRERIKECLLPFNQEVQLLHDAAFDDDAGVGCGLPQHVVFGLVDQRLDFLNIFFVKHGEASLYLMEQV